jgi:hypothetical protein
MSTNMTPNLTTREPDREPASSQRVTIVKRAARSALFAAAIAGMSLTAIPTTARASDPGVGAAIGLGILGGVLAGAAIASTAPVYTAPSSYYYYPNGYYAPAPGYYYAPQSDYGQAPVAYPPANYGYYYAH